MISNFECTLTVKDFEWNIRVEETVVTVDWPANYPLPSEEPSFEISLRPQYYPPEFTGTAISKLRKTARWRGRVKNYVSAYIGRRVMKPLNEQRLAEKNRGSKSKAPNRRRKP